MDFVERLFGISPDGGSGSLEFLLLAITIIGLLLVARGRESVATAATSSQR
jgi:hypothetical protein